MLLQEAGVVDHILVLDCRRSPRLIYDSAKPYPIYLSSSTLYLFGGPNVKKLKVTSMYEVFRHQRHKESNIN